MRKTTKKNMKSKKSYTDIYNKYLLNKQTVTPEIREHIETLNSDDDAPKHYAFHKIMIHNWHGNLDVLFDLLTEYYGFVLLPVNPMVQDEITSFYSNNLNLILKIMKLDFKFLHERIIMNIEIIYNDKTSVDFFNKYETLREVVSNVVNRRFENHELDLSDFCNDAEFLSKKIYFYKLSLLSHYKIVMLRIGKEIKSLNLSRNCLREPPSAILNFFIKEDLTAINLGYNNMESLSQLYVPELYCFKNRLEKFWLEGNPLCDDLDPWEYMRSLRLKFPKLIELDGVKLNPKTTLIPFIRNFLVTPDLFTKLFVEEFMSHYFSCFDDPLRSKLHSFYKHDAILSVSTNSPTSREIKNIPYKQPKRTDRFATYKDVGIRAINDALQLWPRSVTNRDSLTVDVLYRDHYCLILVVDGMYVEPKYRENHFIFRKTFTFEIVHRESHVKCLISNELFTLNHIVQRNAIKTITPICAHPIALRNPDTEEIETLLKIFTHLTSLKPFVAEKRLRDKNWDIQQALNVFQADLQKNKVSADDIIYIDNADQSNSSSVMEIVE